MKKTIAAALLATICLLSSCGNSSNQENWTVEYDVVGTEQTQLWSLKADDFLSSFNSALPENMQLSYLKEFDPDSKNCMLTKNGETWKINLNVFPKGDTDSLFYKDQENVHEWVNNVSKVELSLYSDNEETAKENGIYVRELIKMFTPGAEKIVEDAIGLYGEPEKEAAIDENTFRVSIGSVAYTYMPTENSFVVQPHVESWSEEEAMPSVIMPD